MPETDTKENVIMLKEKERFTRILFDGGIHKIIIKNAHNIINQGDLAYVTLRG